LPGFERLIKWRHWKAATRERERWRPENEEAMARKRAEEPYEIEEATIGWVFL
jgi:hypothetical protein